MLCRLRSRSATCAAKVSREGKEVISWGETSEVLNSAPDLKFRNHRSIVTAWSEVMQHDISKR